MTEPAAQIQPHVCRGCGKPGHNIRRCPEVDADLEGAAKLREEIDALEQMEAEYLRVLEEVGALLLDTKIRKTEARKRLADLRDRRSREA